MTDELRVVSKEYAGVPGVTQFLLRLVGSKANGPFKYTFSDGYIFWPYPRGRLDDALMQANLVERGCSDPTGKKFQKYVDAAGLGYRNGRKLEPGHYVNWLELDRNS